MTEKLALINQLFNQFLKPTMDILETRNKNEEDDLIYCEKYMDKLKVSTRDLVNLAENIKKLEAERELNKSAISNRDKSATKSERGKSTGKNGPAAATLNKNKTVTKLSNLSGDSKSNIKSTTELSNRGKSTSKTNTAIKDKSVGKNLDKSNGKNLSKTLIQSISFY